MNEDLKKRVKVLVDSLYEFSGADFSSPIVRKRFSDRLHRVLLQLESMGVVVTQESLSQGPVKARFIGVSWQDDCPVYSFEHVIFHGRPL